MSTEQFNEILSLFKEFSGPIVAFAVIGLVVLIGFVLFRLFDKVNKERIQYAEHQAVIDNVKNALRNVKALRYTNQHDTFNYYVDCLVVELDKLYNK